MACSLIATGCCKKVPGRHFPTDMKEVRMLQGTVATDFFLNAGLIVTGSLLIAGTFGHHSFDIGLGSTMIVFGILFLGPFIFFVKKSITQADEAAHHLDLAETGAECQIENGWYVQGESRFHESLEQGAYKIYKRDEDGYFMGPYIPKTGKTYFWKFSEEVVTWGR